MFVMDWNLMLPIFFREINLDNGKNYNEITEFLFIRRKNTFAHDATENSPRLCC